MTRCVTKCGSGDVCHPIKVKSQQTTVSVGNSPFKSCYDLVYIYIVVYIVVREVKLIGRNSSRELRPKTVTVVFG